MSAGQDRYEERRRLEAENELLHQCLSLGLVLLRAWSAAACGRNPVIR